MPEASYVPMEDALEIMAAYGPDLANGLTSHGPMAAEALCALDRPDAVLPWVERYRAGMLPRPPARERISRERWRDALAQEPRFTDWAAFFTEELKEAPWGAVVECWVGRLAPGICASATHGVIRVGHATRSLAESESPRRVRELADALASWASTYQELPASAGAHAHRMNPHAAIMEVSVVPPERRRFSGTITSSLDALNEFPAFGPVIELLDVGGDPSTLVSELTDTFARVYLANTHDILTAIVFIHGVTSIAALGNILPYLDDATRRAALRFAWQSSCALYATFGSQPAPEKRIEPTDEDVASLVDRAVAHGDEHAIKFTEACLHQHARHPSLAYLAAARHALEVLPRG
jgi:hypothetical protein